MAKPGCSPALCVDFARHLQRDRGRVAAGQRIVSTYNAGPFVAGVALASFERIGLCHIPVGTGNSERLVLAIQRLRPQAAVLTPSYAAHLIEWASARGIDLAESSVERVLVAGEPGGGEPAFRRMLEQGWGARVTEAMGIGDIGVSLWGECEAQRWVPIGLSGVTPSRSSALSVSGSAPIAASPPACSAEPNPAPASFAR